MHARTPPPRMLDRALHWQKQGHRPRRPTRERPVRCVNDCVSCWPSPYTAGHRLETLYDAEAPSPRSDLCDFAFRFSVERSSDEQPAMQ